MITKPMLASAADEKLIRYPVLVSPKLDGIRCLLVDGKTYTRNFKPIPNEAIAEWLGVRLDSYVDANVALDGELTLRDPTAAFQAVSSAVMSEDGSPDFVYRVFDMVRFGTGGLEAPFEQRLAILKHWHAALPKGIRERFEVVEHWLVTSPTQLEGFERTWLAEGYEGVMLRDPGGPYKCGRSTAKEGYLLKLKRFVDAEATVIGVVEQMHNGNVATRDAFGRTKRSSHQAGMTGTGTLGALLVRDLETDVEFSIGTGFNDRLRADLWAQRRKLKGVLVKYRYQPVGVKEAPRFPVFIGFRDARDL